MKCLDKKTLSLLYVFYLLGLALFSINVNSQSTDLRDIDLTSPEILSRLDALPESIRSDVLQKISEENFSETSKKSTTDSLRQEGDISRINLSLEDKVFGQGFFKYVPTNPTPFSDLPIRSEIILSEGDKLEVFINGSSRNNGITKLKIALDGSVTFEEFGKVVISGLTFQEAEDKISNFLSQFIIFTDVSLTITDLSVVEVSIIGAVNSPGTYRVNPTSSIVGALQYAGGVSKFGSFRNIELKSNGQVFTLDLYKFLIGGEPLKMRPLRSGDIIFVNPRNSVVDIKGEVMRPGLYETADESTLRDLIELSLGENEKSDIENAYVETFSGETVIIKSSEKFDVSKIKKIFVPEKPLSVAKSTRIYGPTLGTKNFENFTSSFKNLVDSIQFSEDIYPYFSILMSKNNLSDFTFKLIPFSLADVNSYSNIQLRDTENIIIFFKASNFYVDSDNEAPQIVEAIGPDKDILVQKLIEDYTITLKGDFYNEGSKFPVFGDINIPDFINYVGGLRDSAEEDNVQFVNFKNNFAETVDLESVEKYSVSGISTLIAPTSKKELMSVLIDGEVLYPGVYEMLPGDTLQVIYEKAGGFTKEASNRSILFTRESIKKKEDEAIQKSRADLLDSILNSIANPSFAGGIPPINLELISLYDLSKGLDPVGRLVGDLSPNSLTSTSLKLENGDSIFVPREPSTVNIIGEVQSPITVSFDAYNDNLMYYIRTSGGFTKYSDKDSIYVIKSDGTSVPYRQSVFVRGSVSIEPGDTIVVPKKLLEVRGLALITIASKTLSEIAFTAASLNAIRN